MYRIVLARYGKTHRQENDCHEKKSFCYIHYPPEIEGTACHTGLHGEVHVNNQRSGREELQVRAFIVVSWEEVAKGRYTS